MKRGIQGDLFPACTVSTENRWQRSVIQLAQQKVWGFSYVWGNLLQAYRIVIMAQFQNLVSCLLAFKGSILAEMKPHSDRIGTICIDMQQIHSVPYIKSTDDWTQSKKTKQNKKKINTPCKPAYVSLLVSNIIPALRYANQLSFSRGTF